jgi:predicted PurR-regulated permease PerM
LISYLIIVAVVAFVILTVLPVFLEQSAKFLGTLPNTISSIEERSSVVYDFVEKYNMQDQYQATIDDIKDQVSHVASALGTVFVSMMTGIFNGFANFLIVMVLTFLMLTEGPSWGRRFWALVYRDPKKRLHHQRLAGKMYDVVGGYVNSQMIIAAISGLLSGLGAFVLALIFDFTPSIALPMASIVFVTAFIPMFGALVGAVIAAVLMLLYSPISTVFFLLFFIVYQQVENNWLAPKIQAKRTQMSALIVLTAATVGLQVGGLFGAFVAIPVAGCAMVLARDYIRQRQERFSQPDVLATESPDNLILVDAETINVESSPARKSNSVKKSKP